MEDALQKLMKESGSTKYANIACSAHKALGKIFFVGVVGPSICPLNK